MCIRGTSLSRSDHPKIFTSMKESMRGKSSKLEYDHNAGSVFNSIIHCYKMRRYSRVVIMCVKMNDNGTI